MEFLNLLIQRLFSPTPEFHAKIRNVMAALVTIAATIDIAKPAFIPVTWYQYIEFTIVVAGSFGIYAQTTSTKH